MTPSLSWKAKFEVMRTKLKKSITKLVLTDVNQFQAATHYNAYVIKSVCFRCRIVELNDQKEKELIRTCEESLLVKHGLSRKFPRSVLCSRISALVVGIMTPRTMIETLKAKSCLGKIRKQGVTSNEMAVQKECLQMVVGKTQVGCDALERH